MYAVAQYNMLYSLEVGSCGLFSLLSFISLASSGKIKSPLNVEEIIMITFLLE